MLSAAGTRSGRFKPSSRQPDNAGDMARSALQPARLSSFISVSQSPTPRSARSAPDALNARSGEDATAVSPGRTVGSASPSAEPDEAKGTAPVKVRQPRTLPHVDVASPWATARDRAAAGSAQREHLARSAVHEAAGSLMQHVPRLRDPRLAASLSPAGGAASGLAVPVRGPDRAREGTDRACSEQPATAASLRQHGRTNRDVLLAVRPLVTLISCS